jgi:hypothetical protein
MKYVIGGIERLLGIGGRPEGSVNPVRDNTLNDAIRGMVQYYGVTRQDFEAKLREGFETVDYGRSSFFLDGEYIVSFVAFKGPASQISTLEVRKYCDGLAANSYGLVHGRYDEKAYARLIKEFELILNTKGLEDFINDFNWSPHSNSDEFLNP